ncbi:CHY zinc finger protein [Bacillus tianshenii]|nr:CHY zinc finger protein [Bacillus tianshenii]
MVKPIIRGLLVDNETRCLHYHKKTDIIAIKFPCCKTYYPCFYCHQETAGHPAHVIPKTSFDEKSILCGSCKYELTVTEYLQCRYQCPNCQAKFNPSCKNHNDLYFEMKKGE